ncbi:MAG: hypothetical protein GXP32_03260 [Kiritimatiellaeota bacterium]|nr:hypothetical protein [Kiritimatiellota bacterium]
MCERGLQVMVGIVVGVAERIIAVENAGPVESSAKAIDKLVELKVVSSSAATQRAATPYGGMRLFQSGWSGEMERILNLRCVLIALFMAKGNKIPRRLSNRL